MSTGASPRHQCMIYDGPPSRTLTALTATIRQRLDAHARCMYMNSPTMVAGLRSQLYAAGTNVDYEMARGALVLTADTAHLVDGRFEVNRGVSPDANAMCATPDTQNVMVQEGVGLLGNVVIACDVVMRFMARWH